MNVIDLKLMVGTIDVGPVASEGEAHAAARRYLERRARDAAGELGSDGDWMPAWVLLGASGPGVLVKGSERRAAVQWVVALASRLPALVVGHLRQSWKVDSLDVGYDRAKEIQSRLLAGELLADTPEALEVLAIETFGATQVQHLHAPVVRDGDDLSAPKLGVFELLEDGATDVLVHDPAMGPIVRALRGAA